MARYGLQLPDFGWIVSKPAGESLPRLRDLVQVGEAAGFSSFWVMDHFFQLPPLGGSTAPILEAYTTLGAIAACTAHAELGAMITGVTYRNPALVAKQVTTLDVLSGGRAILGIGAAWYEVEHSALGFTFPKISERFERLEEAVQICRRMFTEPAAKFEGRFYSVREAHNVPPPIRPGGPPIMIGGSGERKTLHLVAKYADACNIVGSPETVVRLLGVLDRHCRELGRDPKEIRRTRLGSLFVCDTEAQAQNLRRMLAGSGDPNRPGAIEQFTIGTPDCVLDELRALVRTGLDDVIFNVPGLRDPAQLTRVAVLLREACG